MTLVSLLMAGFLLGLKHATEADHVAALAALVTRGQSIAQTLRVGVAWGLVYIVVFGLGSILGMTALSIAIAVPLRFSARHADWAHTALSAIVGAATVGLGLFMVYLTGFDE